MQDRMFDREGNVYRNVSLNNRPDNEATVGEDRLFDNSGKLYRDLAARVDSTVGRDAKSAAKAIEEHFKGNLFGPEDRTSSLGIGGETTADKDLLIGPEDRTFKAMNPNENVEEDYYSVVGRMKDIYAAKNADYGNSFEMTLDKYGIIGAIIRMQDKMNRIDGYYWKPDDEKKVDESLIDTLEDLGNYAIMTSVWLRNQ